MGIGVLTAGLVYLALHFLFVRPMRRLTASLVGFHENPESSARIIVPSQRGDEIGVAERELSDMQRDLVSMLHQKSRLAALGLAVSKINHDLRNLLASSQLLSDQLASVPDPRVQRFAPKLMRSLERAIAFCQSTLSYGRAQEAAPDRRMMLIEPVVAEVRESAGLAADASITWIAAIERGLTVDADPDQLFRVLLNLVRNAAQALENRPRSDTATSRSASPGAAKARSRSWRSPTPAPACRKRPATTCSRRSRPPAAPAAAGLGLAIAAELVRAHGGDIHLVEGTHRRHLPDRDPGPPGGTPERPQRAGAGVSAKPSSFRGDAQHRTRNPEVIGRFRVRCHRAGRRPDPLPSPRNDRVKSRSDAPPRGPCQSGPERVAKALFRDLPNPFSDARRAVEPKTPSETRARSSAG